MSEDQRAENNASSSPTATLSLGDLSYTWTEPWDLEQVYAGPEDAIVWRHSGLAITAAHDVIIVRDEHPEATVFDWDGNFVRTFPIGSVTGHGLTLVEENGEEFLWVADTGRVRTKDGQYKYAPSPSGKLRKLTLKGEEVQVINVPNLPAYAEGQEFRPSTIAVNEVRLGGNGDIYVGDGYGEDYVHHFSADGTLLGSISGEEGAGRFDTPHAVFINRMNGTPELYIADRANKRLQVYTLDGTYLRTVGEGILNTPSSFATDGEHLIVAELKARLAFFGPGDTFLGYLGDNSPVTDAPGWPNTLNDAGLPVRPDTTPGLFNSPHGLAVDAQGNIIVNEFFIGGRIIKLSRNK